MPLKLSQLITRDVGDSFSIEVSVSLQSKKKMKRIL